MSEAEQPGSLGRDAAERQQQSAGPTSGAAESSGMKDDIKKPFGTDSDMNQNRPVQDRSKQFTGGHPSFFVWMGENEEERERD